MKQFFMALIAVVVLVMLFAVGYWFNLPGVHTFLGSANDALTEFFGALFIGMKILFFAGVVLGIAYVVVELRRHSQVKVIGAGKHGYQQAVIHNGQIVHLNQPGSAQLDPMQQLAMLKTVLQLQGQMGQLARRTVEEIPQAKKPLELPPPEGIPAIVRYVDVQDEVPDEMSLLGIHPSDGALELTDWEKLKMLWLVGSSSTGKSNTIFGKALEARNKGGKLLVVDQHASKDDSLSKKLAPLKDAFLRPIAITDEAVLATLQWFKIEFERRVAGASCDQKIVLICDEMNRMVRNEKLKKPLMEIAAICGEESRGFGMYGWFISQKAAHLKWLRDSAITVIAHRVTRFEEAMLACNDNREAAKRLLEFKVGRSYIYGVDFEVPLELQQPLYDVPVVESDPVSRTVSGTIAGVYPEHQISSTTEDSTNEPGKQTDTETDETLTQAQKMKLLKVLELDAQRTGQNDIIRAIWGEEPNTRAGNAAVEELRLLRSFIAHQQRRKLGL